MNIGVVIVEEETFRINKANTTTADDQLGPVLI